MQTIPVRTQKLVEDRYWDPIEDVGGSEREETPRTRVRPGLRRSGTIRILEERWQSPCSRYCKNGWVMSGENLLGDEMSVFVSLPAELAGFGMLGMSLSCMALGLRNGIWRPMPGDRESSTAIVCPPADEFFCW